MKCACFKHIQGWLFSLKLSQFCINGLKGRSTSHETGYGKMIVFWFVSFCLSRKSPWFWMGLTLCFLTCWNWEYWVSKSFSQPRSDEWIVQLLLWLHWISVAAMTQLQPGQKGLSTRGLGAALGALMFGQEEREPLVEIGKCQGTVQWELPTKKKGAEPCSGKGSGKAGTAWCPISYWKGWALLPHLVRCQVAVLELRWNWQEQDSQRKPPLFIPCQLPFLLLPLLLPMPALTNRRKAEGQGTSVHLRRWTSHINSTVWLVLSEKLSAMGIELGKGT